MRASTCSSARSYTTPTSGETKIMTPVFKIQKGVGGGGGEGIYMLSSKKFYNTYLR